MTAQDKEGMVVYGDEAGRGLSEPTEDLIDDDDALDEEVRTDQSNDESAFPEIGDSDEFWL